MPDLKDRIKNLVLEKRYEVSNYDNSLFKLYQDYLFYKKGDLAFDVTAAKNEFSDYIKNIKDDVFKTLRIMPNKYIWGMLPDCSKSEKFLDNVAKGDDVFFIEDAFLRCVVTPAQILQSEQKCYQNSCGYIMDDLTAYFDATRPSRMEKIINSNFEVTEEQRKRCKKVIDKIVKNKISKYNNQPVYEPKIGREGFSKVLVIDQSYKDYSILKGCADDNTFNRMLTTAINENPNADIIIKTHPDAMGDNSLKPKCYYQNVQSHDNIYKLTEAINPISLIEYADKIYVCSSQFGFEALMCGKEVHTFGMPFYAGWGLTIDDLKCARRTKERSLEEIFYIAYIYMAQYVDPMTNQAYEIEDAIDYLIEQRNRYFEEIKNA